MLDTLQEVYFRVVSNFAKDSEQDNYASKLARDLDMPRQRISRHLDCLESMGLIKFVDEGNKKIVVPNMGVVENLDEFGRIEA